MFERLDIITILYSHLPIYILLEQTHTLDINFPMLPEKMFLILLVKSTIPMQDISLTRLQIPMMPDFAVLEYKV